MMQKVVAIVATFKKEKAPLGYNFILRESLFEALHEPVLPSSAAAWWLGCTSCSASRHCSLFTVHWTILYCTVLYCNVL